MKLRFLSRLAVALLSLLAIPVYGINYYDVLSEEDRTVEVTGGFWPYKGDVVIPERVIIGGKTYTVTAIGKGAFENCDALTGLELPASLTYIGPDTFEGCTALMRLVVDEGNTMYASCDNVLYTKDITTLLFCPAGLEGEVDIPNSVTAIGERAFENCETVTSVKFPSSLATIGNYAFSDCHDMTNVDLSSTSLITIGIGAFDGCWNLTNVKLPSSLTSIGSYAFSGCHDLKSVNLSSTSLTFLGTNAFYSCALTSVDLSSTSLTSIEEGVFCDCFSLASVKFPTTLTSIEDMAFARCHFLTSVEFPASLDTIGVYAFMDCNKLASVDLSSTSLKSIQSDAFYNCTTLASVEFPASLTSIQSDAFYNCTTLASVEFPASLTSIENGAFSLCKALTSVDLSSTSLTSIGMSAFSSCEALTSVTLPASLTSIQPSAFENCAALTSLTVDEANPMFVSRDNVLYTKDLSTLLIYPVGLDGEVGIPDFVTKVSEYAFCNVDRSAVYCRPQQPPVALGAFSLIFSYETLKNAVLYVPVGTKAAYMKVDPWRNFWNIEESDFATVGIGGVTAQGEPTVAVRGGKIVVDGASTAGVIEVFSTDGRCAYRGTGTVIEGLPKGAYVVRVGKFTQKVAL